MKKAIIVLLTVLTAFVLCLTASAEDRYDEAVSVLQKLEILPEDFDADSDMTRAEFAVIAYELMDIHTGVTGTYFEDVKPEEEYAAKVNELYVSGIMLGTAPYTFEPDVKISAQDAAVVLVKLLGYEEPAESAGGYTGGYLRYAQRVGIMDSVSLSSSKKGNIAQMIYNALAAQRPEYHINGDISFEGASILESRYDTYEAKGRLNAVGMTAVSSFYAAGERGVRVGEELYETEALPTELYAYIGRTGTVYYRENDTGDKEYLLFAADNKDTVTEINLVDLESVADGKITYKDNNRTKTLSISRAPYIVYNMRAETSLPVLGKNGSMTVIEAEDNDIIIVRDYEICLAESVSETEGIIYTNGKNPLPGINDCDEFIIENHNAEPLEIGDIKQNNVLCILRSTDNSAVYITVSTETVYGRVVSTDGDELEDYRLNISGDEYAVTSEIFSDISAGAKIYNLRATFFLDIYGRIAGWKAESSLDAKVGYLMRVYIDSEQEEKPFARLFTASGEMETLEIREKSGGVMLNDERVSPAYAVDFLSSKQLITYELDGENRISAIFTVGKRNTENLYKLSDVTSTRYRSSNSGFANDVICSDNAVVFVIPANGNEDNYKVGDMSYFVGNVTYDNITFYTYGKDSLKAKVITHITADGDNTIRSLPAMVYKTGDGLSPSGDVCETIELYIGGALKTYYSAYNFSLKTTSKTLKGEPIAEHKLKKGDVVLIGTNSNNEICDVQLIYDYEDNTYVADANPYNGDNSYKICQGRVSRIEDDVIELYYEQTNSYEYFNISAVEGVVVYDGDAVYTEKGSECAVRVGDRMFIYLSAHQPKQVILYN